MQAPFDSRHQQFLDIFPDILIEVEQVALDDGGTVHLIEILCGRENIESVRPHRAEPEDSKVRSATINLDSSGDNDRKRQRSQDSLGADASSTGRVLRSRVVKLYRFG